MHWWPGDTNIYTLVKIIFQLLKLPDSVSCHRGAHRFFGSNSGRFFGAFAVKLRTAGLPDPAAGKRWGWRMRRLESVLIILKSAEINWRTGPGYQYFNLNDLCWYNDPLDRALEYCTYIDSPITMAFLTLNDRFTKWSSQQYRWWNSLNWHN